MKHILPTEIINKILNYLATKAYSEVNQLINDIQRQAVQYVEPIKEAPKESLPPAVEENEKK